MCLPLTTGTTLTVSSVFITGTVVDSRSFSSVILETISASISISWFPSNIDVTHVLLEEPRSPFSRSMRFCKTKKLINAVPSQDRNQGPIRTIFSASKWWHNLTDLLHCKYQRIRPPPLPNHNVPVIVTQLSTYLPASYKTWRDTTIFRGVYHTFLSQAKETQSTSPTEFK